GSPAPGAGDRAPDAAGLKRYGIGFTQRFFDVLRGTEHVLAAHLTGADIARKLADLAAFSSTIRSRSGRRLRIVAIVAAHDFLDHPGIPVFHDSEGAFAAAYGAQEASFLVRPDGYIAWRGPSWREAGLMAQLERSFQPNSRVSAEAPTNSHADARARPG